MGLPNQYKHHNNFAVGQAVIPGGGTGIVEIDTGFGLRDLAFYIAGEETPAGGPVAEAHNVYTFPGTRAGHASFLVQVADAAGAPPAADCIVKWIALVL